MKIVIDNPCHENWDAMTPNEKGAFCSACQKTVIDFSKKTIDEIKNFFVELPQTEKVCGRFEVEQLEDISFDHFFNQFKGWRFFQKAALITYLIFGFSLFGTAQTLQREPHPHMKGEIAYVAPKDTIKKKPVKDSTKIVGPKEDHHILGGPRYIPEEPKNKSKDKPKEKLMGKPSINRNPN